MRRILFFKGERMIKYIFTLVVALLFLNACSSELQQKEAPELASVSYESIKVLIGEGEPLMLEMGSTDCGSCQEMGRLLYQIKSNYPSAHIYFIDIKKEREVALMYSVRMMPTQIFLDEKGEVVDTHVGPLEYNQLMEKLKSIGIIH